MAQPSVVEANGVPAQVNGEMDPAAMPGKRKRETSDDGDEEMEGIEDVTPDKAAEWAPRDQKALIKSYYEVLKSVDIKEPILKRPLPEQASDDEPQAKRQRSAEPSSSSVADKVSSDAYAHLEEMAADLLAVIKASLAEVEAGKSEDDEKAREKKVDDIRHFKEKAMDLFYREKMYPQIASSVDRADDDVPGKGEVVLSLVGFAPSERRLFSSMPLAKDVDVTEHQLPHGMTYTHIMPSSSMAQEKAQTLGEVFSSPRALPTLQAPKQPKTQAKGNVLDLYYPELTDKSPYRAGSYFSQKMSTGHFLDYTNATPLPSAKTKQRERAQSLAGKKPSTNQLEASELESLFRGAFSSFAPCKDDSSALVSSGVAGRMWWQRAGQRNFQRMVEVEYYDDDESLRPKEPSAVDIDEAAIQDSIDNWDDSIVDPTLAEAMGAKPDDRDKEADEILEEVSDLIETLASYQRIRNLNLPNSQNRQTSDPVNGDMLANSGPEPTEEEVETYEVLKAQLALIIKTLPPYAVAKLNGDQLDDLLISTKVQIQSDNYKGTMEEDEAGVQARLRAQQQQQAQQALPHAAVRPPTAQRTPSVSYGKPYQAPNQYGTPTRTPSANQQQYYRHGSFGGGYQQPQGMPPAVQQHHRPQFPQQYSRPPNGFPSQYATQLAKTQTPYGHQNMAHGANQPRVQYPHQQGTPTQQQRYPPNYPQGYPQQGAPSTPAQGAYPPQQAPYTNGAATGPPRTMSPQMSRQNFSPSPHQGQRYGVPQQQSTMQSQMGRFPAVQTPGQHQAVPQQAPQNTANIGGFATTIPEAQQQRILEQAKARVAAQERTAMFGDKISSAQSPATGTPTMDVNRLAAARASLASLQKPQSPNPVAQQAQQQQQRSGSVGSGTGSPSLAPGRVTPVPLPAMPGAPPRKDSA